MQLKVKKVAQSLVVLASIGLTAWLSSAQQARGPVVTADALINAAGNGADWLTYGHDYAETHFSPLAEINAKNVKRLSLVWSAETQAPVGTVEATPLMHNGVLYGILPWNVMYAVDARTGKKNGAGIRRAARAHSSAVLRAGQPRLKLLTGFRERLRSRHIDAVASAVSHEQSSDSHAVTHIAVERRQQVHQRISAISQRAGSIGRVIVACIGDLSARGSGCAVENPAASLLACHTAYNLDQRAVRKLARTVFSDDLYADGRVLCQFRGPRGKTVLTENERHEVGIAIGAEAAAGAVRHVLAHEIQQVVDGGLAEALPEGISGEPPSFFPSIRFGTVATRA